MKYEKINIDRLGKFALYLQAGTLKTQRLTESLSNGRELLDTHDKTSGPLLYFPIMEMPIIFPGEWMYDKEYRPIYKKDPCKCPVESLILFFGLNRYLLNHLFVCGKQMPHLYGGKVLGLNPTLHDLSNNIYELIDVIKYLENVKGIDPIINLN